MKKVYPVIKKEQIPIELEHRRKVFTAREIKKEQTENTKRLIEARRIFGERCRLDVQNRRDKSRQKEDQDHQSFRPCANFINGISSFRISTPPRGSQQRYTIGFDMRDPVQVAQFIARRDNDNYRELQSTSSVAKASSSKMETKMHAQLPQETPVTSGQKSSVRRVLFAMDQNIVEYSPKRVLETVPETETVPEVAEPIQQQENCSSENSGDSITSSSVDGGGAASSAAVNGVALDENDDTKFFKMANTEQADESILLGLMVTKLHRKLIASNSLKTALQFEQRIQQTILEAKQSFIQTAHDRD